MFHSRLPVMSDIVRDSFVELLDLENVGVAVEIASLSTMQAKLYIIIC